MVLITGQGDTLSLFGISEYPHFNWSLKNKGIEYYESRKDVVAKIKKRSFFITGLFKENLCVSINYSTTYSASPNIKISFLGHGHRSWIDIMVSYEGIFKDGTLFDNKYLQKTIQLSNNLAANYITNTLPKSGDYMLTFLPGNPKSSPWKNFDITITGKSEQIYESLEYFSRFYFETMKLSLWWNIYLQRLPVSQYSMSLQGDSHQLEVHFVPKCETNKHWSGLKVY